MEVNEVEELKEHAEHGSQESAMRPVAFTMSVLAVLVAITTVLGHRTHTEAVLMQNKSTDQWNFYQAHKLRANETELNSELLGTLTVANPAVAEEFRKKHANDETKWASEMQDEQNKARELDAEVTLAEKRAGRYDLSEALLEIGLVITSVTLLTRRRAYWFFGMAFAAVGIAAAVVGLLLR